MEFPECRVGNLQAVVCEFQQLFQTSPGRTDASYHYIPITGREDIKPGTERTEWNRINWGARHSSFIKQPLHFYETINLFTHFCFP